MEKKQFVKIRDYIININAITDISVDLQTGDWMLSYHTMDIPRGNMGIIHLGDSLDDDIIKLLEYYGVKTCKKGDRYVDVR